MVASFFCEFGDQVNFRAVVPPFALALTLLVPACVAAREIPAGPGRDPMATNIQVPTLAEKDVHLTLDGKLDETVWQGIPEHDDMTVLEPDLLTEPRYKTHVRYFYTERGMYVGAKLDQPPATLIPRLSSRDGNVNRDTFGITLDTSGAGLFGYWFTVNLGGSVSDGTIAPEREYAFEWDGPWRSATAILPDGWSLEMFLPWSMMAMPSIDGPRRMGFWTNRKVAYINERWGTPAMPFSAAQFMSNMGHLEFKEVHAAQQLDVYPFLSNTWDEIQHKDKVRPGADIFWRPSSNFQVTATLNPDFGSVESDDVVVNLTAFETFFPDKRLFFLEGQEVFITTPRAAVRRGGQGGSGARQTVQNFVGEPTTLVNTRRIGGPARITLPNGSTNLPKGVTISDTEQGRFTDLLGAAKVTGQIGGVRYGLLGAFEDGVRLRAKEAGREFTFKRDGRDFGVARFSYETGGLNRNGIGYIGTIVRRPLNGDAIVHGIDGHLLRGNGAFKLDTQLISSSVSGAHGYGGFADVKYTPARGVQHSFALDYFDKKLDISDLGFIRRNDVFGLRYALDLSTSQGLKNLRTKRTSITLSQEYNSDGRAVRSGAFLRNRWTFLDESEVRTEVNYFPHRWDDRSSLGNGAYKVDGRWFGELSYGTDTAKVVSSSIAARLTQEELGGPTYEALLGFSWKPNDRFSLDADIDYAHRRGWVLHTVDRKFTTYDARDLRPSVALDMFVNAHQQLRFTLQWAGIRAADQKHYEVPISDGALKEVPKISARDFTISRMTAQLRYRWELDPLSDLFIVYTRGSNLPNRVNDEDSFGSLFGDASRDPVIDEFVVKLRYRFGR